MAFNKKGLAAFTVMMLVALAMLVGCSSATGAPTVSDIQEALAAARVQGNGEAQNKALDTTQETLRAGESGSIENNGQDIYVDTVDSFLSALGSDRTVILAAGEYNLTKATDYGGSGTTVYSWEKVDDGYELVFNHLENLTIRGENGADAVSIVTKPRYANVLRFEDCRSVTLDGLAAGHTSDQGNCTGSVLDFNGCNDTSINGCVLYGCGTIGISANNCHQINAVKTTIKECSLGALLADNCYDVRFSDGKIFNCGLESQNLNLIESNYNTGFVVLNTEIYSNDAQLFLSSVYSTGVELQGCRVYNNQFFKGMRISGQSVLVDSCELNDNALVTGLWYVDPEHPAVDKNGNNISAEALMSMKQTAYTGTYDGPEAGETTEPPSELDENGRKVFHVTTTDDFLAAIGSDRTIYLDAALFDLSEADDYAGYGGKQYYWQNSSDGAGLVITGVMNLNIIGMGREKTNIETPSRYAGVLSFQDCYEVTVQGLTAGHTPGADECSGDVISFQGCGYCKIIDCGLFGCGVNGINALECQNLTIRGTEIYNCSGYGAVLQNSYDTVFDGCSIHDCEHNTLYVNAGGNVTWDGKLWNGEVSQ